MQSLEKTSKIFSAPLSSAIWNLDEEQIKHNLQALMATGDIVGVSVIGPQDYIISRMGIVQGHEKQYTKNLNKEEVVSYQDDLVHHAASLVNTEFPSEALATVNLYATYDGVYTNMKDNVIFLVINATLKSLALMVNIMHILICMMLSSLKIMNYQVSLEVITLCRLG